jgi:phosphinothricin acetyltransferase
MSDIRPATPEDADAIAAILNPIISDTTISFSTTPKTADDIADQIAEHHAQGRAFLVATKQDTLQGVASYAPFRKGDGYAQTVELTIYLAEHARGQGLGGDLLQALEDHGRKAGVHALIGGVSAENKAGLDFHVKHGFAHVGRLHQVGRKFERWIDLILMQKIL